jgi:uncharacterized repeat protein (TIGR03803 family)
MRNLRAGTLSCMVAALWITTAMSTMAQTFTNLTSFNGHDGLLPNGYLVQGINGNFYGSDGLGGANGWGNIVEITPQGAASGLYNFCPQTNCPDGAYPQGGLVLASNGTFYGTTLSGGSGKVGVIFEVTPGGKLTTLYSFCTETGCPDGSTPEAGLIQGANGNFYSTTFYGGANSGSNGSGGGTLFELTPSGALSTLHDFCAQANCTDGANPHAAVLQATNGNIYGTAYWGGTNNAGTVFEYTTAGAFVTLHSFAQTPGSNFTTGPLGLIQGSDGNVYGFTDYGGTAADGTIFKITPAGKFATLYNFCAQANCADGSGPLGLLQAPDGNFYGTTFGGGSGLAVCGGIACGTIFELTPTGTLTTLYSFCTVEGCPDGSGPGAMTLGTDGTFYGTTQAGGTENDGTVYSLATGLGPFVEADPNFAKAGRTIGILGNGLTGATSVMFNGTSAAFTVVSGTLIKATVPAGATTGTIAVTTPSGTLNSNVTFVVVP